MAVKALSYIAVTIIILLKLNYHIKKYIYISSSNFNNKMNA